MVSCGQSDLGKPGNNKERRENVGEFANEGSKGRSASLFMLNTCIHLQIMSGQPMNARNAMTRFPLGEKIDHMEQSRSEGYQEKYSLTNMSHSGVE